MKEKVDADICIGVCNAMACVADLMWKLLNYKTGYNVYEVINLIFYFYQLLLSAAN